MYHVQAIGIISLAIYLISLSASRIGAISKQEHRSFWNILLLVTFILTALAGIFLALQVNYKWKVESVEKILHWHVELGLALSATAIFHLTWHLGYYLRLFRGKMDRETGSDRAVSAPGNDEISIVPNLFLLGFTTGLVQLVLIKEVVNLSGGLEMVTGSLLGSWLILSSFGAYMGKRAAGINSRRLMMIFPFSGVATFLLLVLMSRLLLSPGQVPSILMTFIFCLVSALPVCVLSGMLFILLTRSACSRGIAPPGRSFGIETAGGIASGIMVTVLSSNILDNYQLLLSGITVAAVVTGLINYRAKRGFFVIPGAILLAALLTTNPDNLIRRLYFPNIPVVSSRDTRFGNLAIADYNGQRTIFYNHRVYNWGGDISYIEENIHYAMVQRDEPGDVLLVSGGLSNHASEILKYESVRSLTYIELDPELAREDTLAKQYTESDLVKVVNRDAFSFINSDRSRYDVIILILPFPDNYLLNRFYTEDFYATVRRRMVPGGVLMTSAGSGMNYQTDEAMNFISEIYSILKGIFVNVHPVKGNMVYLIASDSPLRTDFANRISRLGIENLYFNSAYLNDGITGYNSEQLLAEMKPAGRGNRLERPFALSYSLKASLLKGGKGQQAIFGILIILLLIRALFWGERKRIMFAASFSVASSEILTLLLLQSTLGYMYQSTGMIIALIMAGLASGAYLNVKHRLLRESNIIGALAFAFLLFFILTPVTLRIQSPVLTLFTLACTGFIPAFLTGLLYSILTGRSAGENEVAGIYASDLLGSAAGFLLFTGIAIPVLGLIYTWVLLAIINLGVYITGKFREGRIG